MAQFVNMFILSGRSVIIIKLIKHSQYVHSIIMCQSAVAIKFDVVFLSVCILPVVIVSMFCTAVCAHVPMCIQLRQVVTSDLIKHLKNIVSFLSGNRIEIACEEVTCQQDDFRRNLQKKTFCMLCRTPVRVVHRRTTLAKFHFVMRASEVMKKLAELHI